MTQPRVLDIGCGAIKLPGAVGMDRLALPGVDVVHDLDHTPWPFEDSTFDHVNARNVMEHVDDLVRCVEEIWRIAKPGATVEVRMPFMGSVNQHTDPTHRRGATHRTFEYFQPGTPFGDFGYSHARLRRTSFRYLRGYPGSLFGTLFRAADWMLLPLLHRFPLTYECYFAGLWPMHDITFHLVVEK